MMRLRLCSLDRDVLKLHCFGPGASYQGVCDIAGSSWIWYIGHVVKMAFARCPYCTYDFSL